MLLYLGLYLLIGFLVFCVVAAQEPIKVDDEDEVNAALAGLLIWPAFLVFVMCKRGRPALIKAVNFLGEKLRNAFKQNPNP
jgi:hypothetical protein